MTVKHFLISLVLFSALLLCGGEKVKSIRFDFRNPERFTDNWQIHQTIPIVAQTEFKLRRRPTAGDGFVLAITAKNSSGLLVLKNPNLIDLNKYPIMRWRWRIVRNLELPEGAKDPDDQGGAIYIGDANKWQQSCVSYRWECNTPVGSSRRDKYRAGLTVTESRCIRNRKTPQHIWVEDERNVREDFLKAYKRMPGGGVSLCIGGNTHNSKSHTILEIDYIEFLPSPTEK